MWLGRNACAAQRSTEHGAGASLRRLVWRLLWKEMLLLENSRANVEDFCNGRTEKPDREHSSRLAEDNRQITPTSKGEVCACTVSAPRSGEVGITAWRPSRGVAVAPQEQPAVVSCLPSSATSVFICAIFHVTEHSWPLLPVLLSAAVKSFEKAFPGFNKEFKKAFPGFYS